MRQSFFAKLLEVLEPDRFENDVIPPLLYNSLTIYKWPLSKGARRTLPCAPPYALKPAPLSKRSLIISR